MLAAFSFVVRQFVIVLLAMAVGCALWTVAYLGLLAVAVMGNHGVGGPLAFPAGILAVVATCAVVGWGISAPASAIGAVFCKIFHLPKIAAIPVVFCGGFLLSYLFYWAFTGILASDPVPPAWMVLKNFTIFLSIPLGIQWWLTEGPGAVFDGFRRWIRSRRKSETGP